MVGRHAIIVQVNAQATVAENGIAADGVVGRAEVRHRHAGSIGERNHIACARADAANDIVGRASWIHKFAYPLPKALVPVRSAPMILPKLIASGAGIGNINAVTEGAGNDVAGTRGRAADEIVGGAGKQDDVGKRTPHGTGSIRTQTKVIALDQIVAFPDRQHKCHNSCRR